MSTMEITAREAIASNWSIPSLAFILFTKVLLSSDYTLWLEVDCHNCARDKETERACLSTSA
jgi:hypothetical protein